MNITGRTLVLSPHLDDAALSLGATIATLNDPERAGSSATVLTVFAGVEDDLQDAGVWDRRAGFTTAGAASRHRRHEDTQAMHELRASWIRLDHLDGQYRSSRDGQAMYEEIAAVAADYDTVLAPGWPLTNPDHAWTLLLALRLPRRVRVVVYAEQPYWAWLGGRPGVPPVPTGPTWGAIELAGDAIDRKHAALVCYQSQLDLLDAEVGEREHPFANVADLLRALASSGEVVAGVVDRGLGSGG